eukprot:Phypoly_transcript_00618.p1 GENE.Phypoly_transcript_00618~~Phypoly_transcript_00618.p1  ORF type:complete len:1448 (+),score=229.82 Phypoly_transcript_00618:543-4346(+)
MDTDSQEENTDTKNGSPDLDDESWNSLLASSYHESQRNQQFLANLNLTIQTPKSNTPPPTISLTPFPSPAKENLEKILVTLHLVYEDLKLNAVEEALLPKLAALLLKLASRLGNALFIDHYLRDFGDAVGPIPNMEPCDSMIQFGKFQIQSPPSIFGWILGKMRGAITDPYPCLSNAESPVEKSRKITRFFDILCSPSGSQQEVAEKLVLAMGAENVQLQDLESLPMGIALPFREALRACRNDPPNTWPVEAYVLIGREDLARQAEMRQKNPEAAFITEPPPRSSDVASSAETQPDVPSDGCDMMENNEISKLRFGRDRRLREVARLLRSSKRLPIRLVQQNGVSDHDFVQDQQARLLLLSQRAMALSVGRGMFTLSTICPMPTDTFSIPPLEIGGKVPATRASVTLDTSALPKDLTDWPEFHNGVAAGLRMAPAPGGITSTWIVYNRPKELIPSHAGLLMALGLQGHLSLTRPKVFEYLQKNPITSCGLLLGLGCAKKGTMDASVMKALNPHLSFLHPPSSTDLEVEPFVQTSAIVAFGLLYMSTAHRKTTEVLLREIGRKPNDDKQFDHDGHSLAAGLALGLVTLGRGNAAVGLSDLKIGERLTAYMVGYEHESKHASHSSQSTNAASLKSSLILGGRTPSVEITSVGAQVALGLMFLKTNNQSIASRLEMPETHYLLKRVRPDLLMMRVVCKSLVLWDSVAATEEWVQSQVPEFIRKNLLEKNEQNDFADLAVDSESLKLAYYNIIGGACLSLGIKYAGSRHQPTYDILVHYIEYFQKTILQHKKLTDKSYELERSHKIAAERALNATALALSVVMAGSGNLSALRILRTLRLRLGQDITYGNHMAIGMGIGLLFLGGGVYTLNTSNVGIAGLVAALYPIFPAHSSDNRYHLQALRHLYVLATEPRCLIARDVDTHAACYIPIEMVLSQDSSPSGTFVSKNIAPCLLPSLELIREFRVCSPRYWPVTVKLPQPYKPSILSQPPVIYVKRKTGFLPYSEDPVGFRSILSRSFPKQQFTNPTSHDATKNSGTKIKREVSTRNWEEFLEAFSSDPSILAFVRLFCNEDTPAGSFFTSVLYECLTHEKPEILQTYIYFRNGAKKLQSHISTSFVMNVRMVIAYYEEMVASKTASIKNSTTDITANKPLLQSFFVGSLKNTLDAFFAQLFFDGDESTLATYLESGTLPKLFELNQAFAEPRMRLLFGAYLAFYEIPTPVELGLIHARVRNVPAQILRKTFVPLVKTFFGNKHSLAVLLKMAPCWPVPKQ